MDWMTLEMERIVYFQKMLLEKYTIEREGLPDGTLISCRNGGRECFYHAYSHEGNYIRKGINQNQDLQKALARKAFLNQTIDALETNSNRLEKIVNGLKAIDPHSIIESLPKAYRNLPQEFFFDDKQWSIDNKTEDENHARLARHQDWASAPFEQSTYNLEHRKHLTSLGFKVRSKSELIIVEQLALYAVPFRYEQVLYAGREKLVPDFSFEDSQGEQFYWEHAGMMDSPEYSLHHKRKMDIYQQYGVVPWDNLIVTYDRDGEINLAMIKSIIENDVIPRL